MNKKKRELRAKQIWFILFKNPVHTVCCCSRMFYLDDEYDILLSIYICVYIYIVLLQPFHIFFHSHYFGWTTPNYYYHKCVTNNNNILKNQSALYDYNNDKYIYIYIYQVEAKKKAAVAAAKKNRTPFTYHIYIYNINSVCLYVCMFVRDPRFIFLYLIVCFYAATENFFFFRFNHCRRCF